MSKLGLVTLLFENPLVRQGFQRRDLDYDFAELSLHYRVWVFQEIALSKHILHFTAEQITWQW